MLKTVLIVDDDAAMTDNLEDILGDAGYDLVSANSFAAALPLAISFKPHVALLDLKLPDDTGINLMMALKQINPDCICALMTAFADVDSVVHALEKGAFHYLQKPVRPIELINMLERIFETIQIREEKRQAEKELIESETRFRTIVESAQDAIFMKDRHLRYTLVNPVMEKLFGIKEANIIGRTDKVILAPDNDKKTAVVDQQVLQGAIIKEDEIMDIGGEQKILHTIKVPLADSNGNITGICGFSRDMTSSRKLETQLLQAQKMEAIGILAGGISHDFNNLLQAILGYTQILMLDEHINESQSDKLLQIERAAWHAKDLTGRLLAFSRKVESDLKPTDLNQVVKQVEKLLERTIPKMIEIRLNLHNSIHIINADPGQIEQVILNIGLNARDAMPDGGRLIIETANVLPDPSLQAILQNNGNFVRLTVSDTGHGMSREISEHIFEPFFTTKRPGKGTGLGMAMVYGIVKNHKGHVDFKSRPGHGTIFNIYLPAAETGIKIVTEESETPVAITGNGETVMVVDDELSIRDQSEEMLTLNGYQVLTAKNGEEAIDIYREKMHIIDMVIIDLIMPGMGGRQCMAELLKINPDALILIASGFTIEDPDIDEVLSKAAGVIQKPYSIKQLMCIVSELVVGDV